MQSFNESIEVYVNRPQVVNRKCGGAVMLLDLSHVKLPSEDWKNQAALAIIEDSEDTKQAGSLNFSLELSILVKSLHLTYPNTSRILVRKSIPKQSHVTFPLEIILTDEQSYTFIPVEVSRCQTETEDSFALNVVGVVYTVSYDSSANSFHMDFPATYPNLAAQTISQNWLQNILLPKLQKWADTDSKTDNNVGDNSSMKLVDVEVYYKKYTQLKDKYGKEICEIWPECTDPLKFVYEDVAIACYLTCLWEKEAAESNGEISGKQRFVDLGCGNGLLVYILTQEGYPGYGIDTRRRKIWSMFGSKADLRELSIVPSDAHLFPECDWLIGNHSDELTPWIPVIASRSSSTCRFFLLPCCPHDFTCKYQRKGTNQSVYMEYMDYICAVTQKCGFSYKRDKLRIPSTKKECIVGFRPESLSEEKVRSIESDINHMISGSCPLSTNISSTNRKPSIDAGSSSVWSHDFIPREQTERLRNCVTVDRGIQLEIINTFTAELLSYKIYKEKPGSKEQWNCGGKASLSVLAKLCSANQLKALKAECGGLKTLLKNNHHIFKVLPGGEVRLTDFTKDMRPLTADSKSLVKTKLCWFSSSHPDGCILPSADCRYAHGQHELKEKPYHQGETSLSQEG